MIKLQQVLLCCLTLNFCNYQALCFTPLCTNGMTSPSTESLLWALAIVASGT